MNFARRRLFDSVANWFLLRRYRKGDRVAAFGPLPQPAPQDSSPLPVGKTRPGVLGGYILADKEEVLTMFMPEQVAFCYTLREKSGLVTRDFLHPLDEFIYCRGNLRG